ncbi:MAG: DUF2066 domain-containing protein [Gammaproteobacteria bacterium]|nr:DUF2066 domain-containing protein [Gammaproteobacteria bacterium]
MAKLGSEAKLRNLARLGSFGWLSLCLSWTNVCSAEVVPWLYHVEVPVESQTSSARLDASRVALLQVLTRLTGLVHVPRHAQIERALAAPDLFYSKFRFVTPSANEVDQSLNLLIEFEPRSVLRLIKDSALPIWGANRPLVVAWVVVEQGIEREIIAAGSVYPVAVALQQRARERGLTILFPLLDLEDRIKVDPAVVWGRMSQVLLPASERYGADIVLVGRVQALDGGSWAASWEFWLEGLVIPLNTGDAAEVPPSAAAAVDLIADELTQRYAVLGRAPRQILLGVSGIGSPADYGNLLNYLEALEFVDLVNVTRIDADHLGLIVTTRAGPEQLLRLLETERRLHQPAQPDFSSADIELVWEG